MPDVFVPADTSKFTPLIQDLSQQQLFTAYVVDRQQQLLKKYPTEAEFLTQYAVSNDEVDKFILYASQTIKEMDSHEVQISREPIKTILKAQAARFKWGDNAYFKVINTDDVTFKKGLEQ
ncbi:hypothetical protein ACRQ5D_09470 [Mucilaginibacter sp. P25]